MVHEVFENSANSNNTRGDFSCVDRVSLCLNQGNNPSSREGECDDEVLVNINVEEDVMQSASFYANNSDENVISLGYDYIHEQMTKSSTLPMSSPMIMRLSETKVMGSKNDSNMPQGPASPLTARAISQACEDPQLIRCDSCLIPRWTTSGRGTWQSSLKRDILLKNKGIESSFRKRLISDRVGFDDFEKVKNRSLVSLPIINSSQNFGFKLRTPECSHQIKKKTSVKSKLKKSKLKGQVTINVPTCFEYQFPKTAFEASSIIKRVSPSCSTYPVGMGGRTLFRFIPKQDHKSQRSLRAREMNDF